MSRIREELRAREERERRARAAVLDRLRRFADRGGRTEEDLDRGLQWPGGRVGIGAVLRDLAERGEAHERPGGAWFPARPGEEEMEFAAEVRARRTALGLTQSQLAARCGWSQGVQSRMEQGHQVPDKAQRAALVRELGLGSPAPPPRRRGGRTGAGHLRARAAGAPRVR